MAALRVDTITVGRFHRIVLFHMYPTALEIGALVVKTRQLEVGLPACVVGQLKGLEGVVAMGADGLLSRSCQWNCLREKWPQAPKRLGPKDGRTI